MLLGQKAVDKIGEVKISGDIIPKGWRQVILDYHGHADMNAIAVYARLVFLCRPGNNGEKKFAGKMVHITYGDLADYCNFSVKQIKRAVKVLERLGLIYTEKSNKAPSGNESGTYKYYMVVPEKYASITTTGDLIIQGIEGGALEGQASAPQGMEGGALEGQASAPQGIEGGALEGQTKTKKNKKNKKRKKEVGTCPFCGENIYEIVRHDGKVFFGHLDGHEPNAKCKETFSSIAEIQGYEENPTRDATRSTEMPEDVRQNIDKLLKNMSIN